MIGTNFDDAIGTWKPFIDEESGSSFHVRHSSWTHGRIKEVRQIIIMRLKWPDLSILMTQNAGLFVEATMLLSMLTMDPLSKT